MKLNNVLKIEIRKFLALCSIIIFVSSLSSITKKSSTQKDQAVDIIQNQLENLISKLEKRDKYDIQPLISNESTIGNINGLDFSDEVIEAFHSLNHDFLEYQNILSNNTLNNHDTDDWDNLGVIKNFDLDNNLNNFQEQKKRIKNLYEQNEENFKKLCVLHEDNNSKDDANNSNIPKDEVNDVNTKRYYNEIESLTSDISLSFESFDKLEKIEENKKNIKQKISMIREMEKSISEMKEKIDTVKKNKIIVNQKRENIRQVTEKILNLYNRYLNLEKNIDIKAKEELENIKRIVNDSNNSNQTIQKYIFLYNKILNFYKNINTEKKTLVEEDREEEIQEKFEIFGRYISRINNSDKLSLQIR